jgi:hypothetical protein
MFSGGASSAHDQREIKQFFYVQISYRYIDVLPKFAVAYNKTVHTTNGMAPVVINDSTVLDIWNIMEDKIQRVRAVKP